MTHNGVVAAGGRLTDWISLGVLASSVPRDAVDEAVAAAGKGARRSDGKLPPHVLVYFAMALALFAEEDYEEVATRLTETLASWGCWDDSWSMPTSGGITQARQRLGPEPLELLFDKVAEPVAGELTRGAFLRHWRLMAIDGFELDVPDTPANAAAFGVTQGGNPQLRLLALTECGTHALIDAVFDGVGKASEQVLARRLLGSLGPGMLLLADRNFPGYELWGLAAATGADLAWRIKKNLVFPPVKVLPDGSFHSIMRTPAENVRHGLARAADGTTRTEPFRLATTLLDHEQAPAAQVAALYHQRWEIENSYGELKTRLRGASFILRSRSPELVRQELFALLTVYQALCALRTEAARTAGIDPDRISFTVTVRIARDHASCPAGPTPAGSSRARSQAIRDILGDLLPPRRGRQCDRVKKPPKNTFASKKRDGIYPPGTVTYKIKVSRKASLPAGTP